MMEAFARAAEKREGSSDFVEAILRERPELQGQKIEYPVQGNNSHVVFIGDRVFKGPRGTNIYGQRLSKEELGAAIDNIDEEAGILKQLKGKKLPIPEFISVGKESVFFEMTKMPGDVLDKNFEKHWSPEEQRSLARDLINFVINLANAVPQKNGAFLVQDDFGYRNILLRPGAKEFAGIVDFGFATYRTEDEWIIYGGHSNNFCKMLEAEFDRRKSEIGNPLVVRRVQKWLPAPC